MTRKAIWKAVDLSRHERMYWRKPTGYAFALGLPVLPVGYEELSRAVTWLPLAIERTAHGTRPVAIMRATQGQHSPFITEDGTWRGGYVPAALRSFPFSLARAKSGKSILTVCEDEAYLSEDPQHGSRMFDPLGNMGKELRELTDFISALGADLQQAGDCAQELAQAHCLEEIDAEGLDPGAGAGKLFTISARVLSGQQPGWEALSLQAQRLAHALFFAYPRLETLRRMPQGAGVTPTEHQARPGTVEPVDDFVGQFFSAMDSAHRIHSDTGAQPVSDKDVAHDTSRKHRS